MINLTRKLLLLTTVFIFSNLTFGFNSLLKPIVLKKDKNFYRKKFKIGSSKEYIQSLLDKIYVSSNKVDKLVDTTCFLAIVIDDVGTRRGIDNFLDISYPLTFSVLPELEFSNRDIKKIIDTDFEIMLHMPMESENLELYPVDLTIDALSTKKSNINKLKIAIKSVKQAVGINNHQGSYITKNREVMNYFLDEVKKNDLFFIDSYTSSNSVAYKTAFNKGIPCAKRDVFLDNLNNVDYICKNIKKSVEFAKKNRTCIAIGHTLDATAKALKKMEKYIIDSGVEIIYASDIVQIDYLMKKEKKLTITKLN